MPFQNETCCARSRTASSGSAAHRPSQLALALAKTHDRSPTSAVAASFQLEARSMATTTPSREHGQLPFRCRATRLAELQHDVLPQPMPGAPATLWPVAR